MEHPRDLESTSQTTTNEAGRVRTIIADLSRVIQILDYDVATEEGRSQISDQLNAEYPMLARTIAARRDNLKATIAVLEARLASANSIATPEAKKLPNSLLRRPRRNASPRRFEAWLRLKRSMESGFNPT
jgi:ABC-type transporter Mla subunit MlaD